MPRLEGSLIPANYAQEAQNCILSNGTVTPFDGTTSVDTPTKAGTKETIYKFNDSFWFHWTDIIDCVRGPVSDDDDEVTYWTGDGVPKLTDTSIATAGAGTDYPNDSYTLGVPQPDTPSAAVSGTLDSVSIAIDRSYLVTFVCEAGISSPEEMEGPPSLPSNIVLADDALDAAILLANEIRSDFINHAASARHGAGNQSTAAMPVAAYSITSLLALGAVELTLYAAHNADAIAAAPTWHSAQELPSNALTSAVAPTTLEECVARLNDLKAKHNTHEALATAHTGASVTADQVSTNNATYVTVTIPEFPSGDYNFTAKRIYRTQDTGQAGTTEYQYVGEVTGDILTYDDYIPSISLGDEIKTTEWDGPPSGMHSIRIHPNGFGVGADGMALCTSVAYQLHAWPTSYQRKVDYPIVGIEIFGSSILVVTTAKPYIFTGSEPDNLAKEKTEIMESCTSKKSITAGRGVAFYASPSGIMMIGPGAAKNITEDVMGTEAWTDLDPTSIIGAFHDGRYHGFYDNGTEQGGFILDPATEELTWTDTYATAAFVDEEDDTLYLMVGNNIVSWNTNSNSPMTATWKSRKEIVSAPVNPGVAQVRSNAYPVTFKLYAETNGSMTLKKTKTVSDSQPFWLPSGYLSDTFEVEITGSFKSCYVAETIRDLKGVK